MTPSEKRAEIYSYIYDNVGKLSTENRSALSKMFKDYTQIIKEEGGVSIVDKDLALTARNEEIKKLKAEIVSLKHRQKIPRPTSEAYKTAVVREPKKVYPEIAGDSPFASFHNRFIAGKKY
jgi:hypothetical protein